MMIRTVRGTVDYFASPSIFTVAKWLGVISATSFFAGFCFGYLAARRSQIGSAIESVTSRGVTGVTQADA